MRRWTWCLAAFARLALAEGDPERAALAAGAADGLRQRAGLRAWPIRGAGKPTWRPSFARSWAPRDSSRCSIRGARLSQREAAAAVQGEPTATR
jgi:hypothetical protein